MSDDRFRTRVWVLPATQTRLPQGEWRGWRDQAEKDGYTDARLIWPGAECYYGGVRVVVGIAKRPPLTAEERLEKIVKAGDALLYGAGYCNVQNLPKWKAAKRAWHEAVEKEMTNGS